MPGHAIRISFFALGSPLSGVAECLGLSVLDLAGGERGREDPDKLPNKPTVMLPALALGEPYWRRFKIQ